ncbi:MAG TPA: helix-turn-helix domain-containing protein [Chloroflexota bacterium]|nr:helix-turn-helix domain-containing protein [Chloroflexota bacterium]
MSEWLTASQLADRLQVSEHTIRYWLRHHLVPSARKLPSNEWRVPAEAIEELLRLPDVSESEKGHTCR